ncbi:hypothetical protein BSKO_12249 [Bryopsis sp. KO-2023]|nr:hypothetical protein BSKO_12249 [Bryopsis sp. KO-2023]
MEERADDTNGMLAQVPRPPVCLIPFRHTKVVHLIRHAEGFHNVAGALGTENYASEDYFDAHLTKKGWAQVAMLQSHIKALPNFRADVVMVSPMTRTLETASGVFGSKGNGPTLMKSQTEEEGFRTEMCEISADGVPPFVAMELCRELSGLHPCDRRRPVNHYKDRFPSVDFSLVASEADPLWEPTHREEISSIHSRARQFLDFLAKRPESHIAVVSHSAFLRNMCRMLGDGLGEHPKTQLHSYFVNCELRTVTLIHERGHPDTSCPFSFRPPQKPV